MTIQKIRECLEYIINTEELSMEKTTAGHAWRMKSKAKEAMSILNTMEPCEAIGNEYCWKHGCVHQKPSDYTQPDLCTTDRTQTDESAFKEEIDKLDPLMTIQRANGDIVNLYEFHEVDGFKCNVGDRIIQCRIPMGDSSTSDDEDTVVSAEKSPATTDDAFKEAVDAIVTTGALFSKDDPEIKTIITSAQRGPDITTKEYMAHIGMKQQEINDLRQESAALKARIKELNDLECDMQVIIDTQIARIAELEANAVEVVTEEELWDGFDYWTTPERLSPFTWIAEAYPEGIKIVKEKP